MNVLPGLAVATLLLALAPLGLPPYAMTLLTEALILGLFAMSLDLMVGYTRLLSFGHAAAYGLGAYTCGNLLLHTSIPLVFAVPIAAAFSGIAAIGVAWVCTLASGVSFSMLTLAFAQLLYAVAFKWTSVTGASDGLAGIPRSPGPFGITVFAGKSGFYYLVLACLLGAFLFCRTLVRSPFGAVLRGIRENEAKTLSLGYNTRRYKIAVVAIAFALGGLAGALYAPFAGFANTELLFWLFSGQVLIMVIVGGSGTLVGPIIGAAFFMLVSNLLSSWTDSWALFFGLIFIGFVLFAPQGIWGLATRVFTERTVGCEARAVALLELDGLTRRFGGIIAVDSVSMRVEMGEVRAVIGPNGAGKSTLFNLITGVVPPSDGGVRFDNESLTGLSPYSICQRGISRTFQITSLFPEMTARENARLAAQARHARRWQPYGGGEVFGDAGRRGDAALERLGLTHVAARPAGLLSHGDQRLLEVAMALAQGPRLLLLDEPTQGLSVEETAQAVETLAGLLSDGAMTVLLVEHDMEVVFRLARMITVLHRGAVIADGSPDAVKADAEVQRAYLGGLG